MPCGVVLLPLRCYVDASRWQGHHAFPSYSTSLESLGELSRGVCAPLSRSTGKRLHRIGIAPAFSSPVAPPSARRDGALSSGTLYWQTKRRLPQREQGREFHQSCLSNSSVTFLSHGLFSLVARSLSIVLPRVMFVSLVFDQPLVGLFADTDLHRNHESSCRRRAICVVFPLYK